MKQEFLLKGQGLKTLVWWRTQAMWQKVEDTENEPAKHNMENRNYF